MKRLLMTGLCGAILFPMLGSSSLAQERIATVDLRKVFDNYWKRKEGDAAIKERVEALEKDNREMVEKLRTAREDYQTLLASANDNLISSEEREKRKKAAEEKLKQVKISEDSVVQYHKNARETMDQQTRRMRDSILSEIKAVVNAKAQSGGYRMVIDTAAESISGTQVVLYTSGKEHDLTDAVLSQLNSTAPPGTLKAGETRR